MDVTMKGTMTEYNIVQVIEVNRKIEVIYLIRNLKVNLHLNKISGQRHSK